MLGCSTVTVLVPEQLTATPDSLLCGSFTSSEDTADGGISYAVVITGSSVHRKPLCLGRINNGNRMQTRRTTVTAANNEENAVWVELQTQPYITLQSVTIQEGRLRERTVPLQEVNLVVYDASEICRSELIARKFPCGSERDHANDIVPYLIHCVQRDCKDTYSPKNKSIGNLFILSLLRLILLSSWIPRVVLQAVESVLVNKLDYSSTALRQILFRIAQMEKIQEEIKSNNKGTLLSGRLLLMILLDVLAGIAIACVISSHVSVTDVYTNFRSWTKVVAGSVDLLLEWLRGAPAGLKLNQPLTQALASFFSYHVHLWRLYLELAEPVVVMVVMVLVWVGVCGASAQVAVMADLLDLASLHLYCFYVYAARIHMLQISILGSQWRAFRGRKWNPLKQRVDGQGEGEGGAMGRVLTPVLLTLSLFLLPTTTVYYLVFITVRIGLHVIRGLLTLTIWLLNTNPLYLLLLNVIASPTVKGDIFFSTIGKEWTKNSTSSSPLLLRLHTWPSPLCEVLGATTLHPIFPPRPAPRWKYILSSIMFGQELL